MWLGGQFTFRTFYQRLDGQLIQLARDSNQIESSPNAGIPVFVAVDSAIAATCGPAPDLSIIYLTPGTHAPTELAWKWVGGAQTRKIDFNFDSLY